MVQKFRMELSDLIPISSNYIGFSASSGFDSEIRSFFINPSLDF